MSAGVFQAQFSVPRKRADGPAEVRKRSRGSSPHDESVDDESGRVQSQRAVRATSSDPPAVSDAKAKERLAVWDARMQAALSALLGRLLCSRRALEAAWSSAPGSTAAQARRAMVVVPALRLDVRAIRTGLDKNQYTSMALLLDDVRTAIDVGRAKHLAESGGKGSSNAIPVSSMGDSLAAQESPLAQHEPTGVASSDVAWLFDTLKALLRYKEAEIVSGRSSFPESIANNHEAYVQADWQTSPYSRRPYVRLTDYQIRIVDAI